VGAADQARPGDVAASMRSLVVRFLEGFGPASMGDIAQFATIYRPPVQAALAALGDDLVRYEGPNGELLYDVPGGLLPSEDVPAPPRLLPMWDSTLLAYADRSRIVPPACRTLVMRKNGDVLPTILDWLGERAPRQCDGASLLPFVRDEGPARWRDAAHWEYDFRDTAGGKAHEILGIDRDDCSLAAMRDDDYAYVHFAGLEPLLFDLRGDPNWLVNVAEHPAHREACLRYARRMLSWRLRHADRTLTGYGITTKGLVESR
jgi:hypothetical protein